MIEVQGGKKIDIAGGTRVTLQIDGVELKLNSKMIGQETAEFIAVKIDIVDATINSKLFEGNKVTVRYLQDDSVYGFETAIIAAIDKPSRLLFLNYPDKIFQVSLRKKKRFDCYLPCDLHIYDDKKKATLLDLSNSGARCMLPNLSRLGGSHPPELDQRYQLALKSPADDMPLLIPAKVVNFKIDQSLCQLGLAFEFDDEVLEARLKSLVEFLAIH